MIARASRLPGFLRNYQGRLTRIERYVLTHTLRSVAVAFAIIALVIMLIDFVEVSREVGGRVDTTLFEILGLVLMKSPSVILQLLPFVFLFGTLGAFVALNRRSELIAMRAAGVSAWRFIFPAAGAALLIGVLTVVALNPIAAWLASTYERQVETRLDARFAPGPGTVWLRQGDGRSQVVIRARSRDEGTGTLNDVSMFVYSTDDGGRRIFARRIEAERAVLRPGQWELTNAREAAPGEQAVRYSSLSIPSDLDVSDAFESFQEPRSVPFWGLPPLISRIEAAGFSATAYRLHFQQLLATPLLFAAMSILAAAFSLRLLRLGGLAGLAISGVSLGFLFFFFNEISSALGEAEILPPVMATWLPPVIVVLFAFTLLCYTEDG